MKFLEPLKQIEESRLGALSKCSAQKTCGVIFPPYKRLGQQNCRDESQYGTCLDLPNCSW